MLNGFLCRCPFSCSLIPTLFPRHTMRTLKALFKFMASDRPLKSRPPPVSPFTMSSPDRRPSRLIAAPRRSGTVPRRPHGITRPQSAPPGSGGSGTRRRDDRSLSHRCAQWLEAASGEERRPARRGDRRRGGDRREGATGERGRPAERGRTVIAGWVGGMAHGEGRKRWDGSEMTGACVSQDRREDQRRSEAGM